jgi:predicted molibdopterin-dependent oxidoreductase YjgC
VLKPLGKSRPDWRILQSLAEKMGILFEYQDTQKIFDDLCRCIPAFKGLSYEKIGSLGAMLTEAGKLGWPSRSGLKQF